MAVVLQITFDAEQTALLATLSVDLLAALEGLLDRLERLHGSKPAAGDRLVPGSIDLAAIVAELKQLSPEQRRALAADVRAPTFRGDLGDIASADASLYTRTLFGPGNSRPATSQKRSAPRRRSTAAQEPPSLPRYRLRRDLGDDPTTSAQEPVPRYRTIASKIEDLKRADLHQEDDP